jgi:hypothetical protein
MVARLLMSRSAKLYCFTAARMPSGMATTTVTASADPPSSSVAGSRSAILCSTGCPSRKE